MRYQKPSWMSYGLEIEETILTRDRDLVPLLVLMHDGAVDYWKSPSGQLARRSDHASHYFEAVNKAGLRPVAEYVSRIQKERSEAPALKGQACFNSVEVVRVIDETSPFFNWSGEIGYSFYAGEAWRYECHMEARGGGGARLTLTFAQSQLSL